jgi:hypothetical protein
LAPKTNKNEGKKKEAPQRPRWLPRLSRRNAIGLGIACLLLAVLIPGIIGLLFPGTRTIAALFTREVHHWERQIGQWAGQYDIDANLIATIMQVESCGYAGAASSAGAQGLFQVMPMHFAADERASMTDPDTNARRGLPVIAECLQAADNDAGLALACYNGGMSMIYRPQADWPDETRRYYAWASGIYADARRGAAQSAALDDWLRAGGWTLCQHASASLGLPTSTPPLFPVGIPTLAPMTLAPLTALPPGGLPTLAVGTFIPPTALPPGVLPTFDASTGR